jgi:hypothetical protein
LMLNRRTSPSPPHPSLAVAIQILYCNHVIRDGRGEELYVYCTCIVRWSLLFDVLLRMTWWLNFLFTRRKDYLVASAAFSLCEKFVCLILLKAGVLNNTLKYGRELQRGGALPDIRVPISR